MDSEKRWVVEKIKQLTPRAEEYKAKIESWLSVQDDASIKALLDMFDDAEFVKAYVPYFEAFHFAYIVVQITKGEWMKTSEACFIRNGRSLADLEHIIRKLRFVLWRIEFLNADAAGKELRELCEEYEVSTEALHQIIRMNAIFPKKSYLAVLGAFLENGRVDSAKEMVFCALESYPGDEDFESLSRLL